MSKHVKTVFLHIGTHKTGSTSIQKFLAAADDELANQGIVYPLTGRPDSEYSDRYGQHVLYWSLVGKRGVDSHQVWRDLAEEIAWSRGQRVVISAEGFEGCSSEQVARLLAYLNPHSVHVIVYLRNPLDFLVSAYKQRIKMGTYARSFEAYVRERVDRCDYGTLLARWEQFDRVERVIPRVFDKVKKEPGLEADFAAIVGADLEPLRIFMPERTNISPGDDVIQCVRWLNVLSQIGGKEGHQRHWMRRVRGNVLSGRWPGRTLVRVFRPFCRETLSTETARKLVREALSEKHRSFLKKYVASDDWGYYRF